MEFTFDKDIYICNGANCKFGGTQEELKEWMLKEFEEPNIGKFNCLNRCHENFAFFYKGKAYSAKTEKKFLEIIKSKPKV